MIVPVRARSVLNADGSRNRSLHVFCPRLAHSVEVSRCERCEHARSVSCSVVECSPPGAAERVDEGTPVGAIVSPQFHCACGDVPVRVIETVVPPEPWALPIVDARGRFFGFISKRLLADMDLPPRLALAVPAMHVASGSALAVHETCSLRCVIHEMAIHGTRIIAILDTPGELRGVLTDIEALRAIANEASASRQG